MWNVTQKISRSSSRISWSTMRNFFPSHNRVWLLLNRKVQLQPHSDTDILIRDDDAYE